MSGPAPATTGPRRADQKRVGSGSVATGLGTDGLFEWLMYSRVRTTWCWSSYATAGGAAR